VPIHSYLNNMPVPKLASCFMTFWCTEEQVKCMVPIIQRWTLRNCKYYHVCKVITHNASVLEHTIVHVVAFPHLPQRVGVFCRNMYHKILRDKTGPNRTRLYRYGPLQSMDKLFSLQNMTNAIVVQDQLPKNESALVPYLCTFKRRVEGGPCADSIQGPPSPISHSSRLSVSDNGSGDSRGVDREEASAVAHQDDQRPNTFIIREEQLVEKALAFSMHNMNDTAIRNDLPHVLSAMYQSSGMRLHSELITHGIPQRISDEFTSRADDEFADRFSPFYFANLICTDPSNC
jgi:hypothetical protein